MPRTITFRSRLLAIACAVSLAAHAMADTARKIDVPAGDLSTALQQVANQSGAEVIYFADQLKGIHTKGVQGEFTAEQAIAKLLEGTQFHVAVHTSGALLISTASRGSVERTSGVRKNFGPAVTGFTLAQADIASRTDPENDETSSGMSEKNVVELEEIIVTGTHIRSSSSGASPSFSFDQEDFAQAGATTVQQILRQLPQNFQGGSTEVGAVLATSRNGGGENANFGTGVNLRGLGNSSTLVLLNGRRLPSGGLGAYVDVSTIPLSALARIDVVPDGASAVYGSDAVGGVVNFVLRNDFDGFETSVRHGAVTDGNLRELDANMLFGTTWSSGSALVSLSYNDRDPLLASERDFASSLDDGRETHLTPEDRTRSLLIDGHQQIGEALTLSATLYQTVRDASFVNFQVSSFSSAVQSEGDGSSDTVGGTLSLDWRVANDWVLGLAQTLARNDVERDNFTITSAGTRDSSLNAEHEISVTDIQAEGPVFSMPGGSARLAAGGEHRRESLELFRRFFGAPPGNDEFSRDVNAAYLEAFLPFIGEANRTAWTRRLELTAAVRYEDYDDVGSTTNSKFGAVWSPSDGMALRATYGTSFRAPYLFQFDTANAAGLIYNSGFDPTEPVIATLLQAPAPNLAPEEAVTWTAGLDFTLAALGGLEVTATYFDIDYSDRISAVGFVVVPFGDPSLGPLLSQPPDPAILAEIARIQIENPAQFGNFAFPATLADVQATVDGRVRNQAETRVSGVDLTLNKSFQAAAGTVAVGANASYLISFENQATSAAPTVDVVDTIFNPVDLRVRGYASWAQGGWMLSAIVNYMDDYKDNQLQPLIEDISSWTTVDLGVTYTFSMRRPVLGGLTLRFNAINAFDKDPPRVNDLLILGGAGFDNPGFDPENANPIGRFLSLQVSKKW